MRGGLMDRTEALDKVKALELLPDGVHITARLLADYFEVGERAINAVVTRHRAELSENGYTVLKGADLRAFLSCNLQLRKVPGAGLGIFPRRAVLNVAMLLRDSEVARQVRRRLLDLAEPPAGSGGRWPEAMVAEIAERAVLGELREAHAALARQLELERRLIAALSARVVDTSCEVRTLGGRVDMLCTMLASPGPGRRRRTRRRP